MELKEELIGIQEYLEETRLRESYQTGLRQKVSGIVRRGEGWKVSKSFEYCLSKLWKYTLTPKQVLIKDFLDLLRGKNMEIPEVFGMGSHQKVFERISQD